LRLIKQALLAFREGTSDKVYEVDLCEVGAERYVVNFRYGRRGAQLKDGSKTVVAVPLAEAQHVFDQLVASKVAKGYRHAQQSSDRQAAPPASAPDPAPPAPSETQREELLGPREEAILRRLRRGRDDGWPLGRVLWRAGELGLRQAEPFLLRVIADGAARRSAEPRRAVYGAIWALARIGARGAIPRIKEIYEQGSDPALRRVAAEALRLLYAPAERERFVAALVEGLPQELSPLARHGTPEAFDQALRRRLEARDGSTLEALHAIYLVDSPTVRPALLSYARTAPLVRDHFRPLRGLYKAAELRRDAELFGLLAYRFEKVPGAHVGYWQRRHGEILPYTSKTQDYLRRRVWRTLRRLGQLGSDDFARLAVGVLLPFTDADGGEPRTRRHYSYTTRGTVEQRWDRFASYWAFNHLLVGRSRRYRVGARAWRQVSSDEATGREESFPELWERAPQALLHLLDESCCERVHVFAVRAISSSRCAEFVSGLDLEAIGMLLARPYAVTAAFGFELARRRWDPRCPDLALLRLVVECVDPEARAEAWRWIEAARERVSHDTGLLATLVTSAHADNRERARALLRAVLLGDDEARVLIGRALAELRALPPGDAARARAGDAALTLLACFRRQLSQLGLDAIRDLLRSPLPELQALAGDVLAEHETLSRSVPDDILVAMIDSPSEAVHALGVRLLGQLPDHKLLEYRETLLHLSTHAQASLRTASRPIVVRLARAYRDFGAVIVLAYVDALLRRDAAEGVPEHLLQVLREDLREQLRAVDEHRTWRLLSCKRAAAQELGGVLLAELPPERLALEQIVKLASHEILAVREASWALFASSRARVEADMATAIRLLDAKWQDSRRFAMDFVRQHFDQRQLTPSILVAICDSVRDEVRAFGRELISRYFAQEHGQGYLLKLSEHPSADLQLFASTYLETYAAGDVARLRELRHFFVSVLSRVNRARVAKQRCLAFLAAEAERSFEAAAVVAEIFGRQSATMAIGDKAVMIEAMVRLRRRWGDDIALPLQLREPERRGATDPKDAGGQAPPAGREVGGGV
jgi:hypothetical protein